jgi:serine/threonine protein kinase
MLTDGKIMACKQIRCRRSNLVNVQRELDICVRLSRESYIAQFSGDVAWNQATSDLLLYMEYYPGGDLHEVIKFCNLHSTTVDPILATRWALEIAKGVLTCHENGVIHRDIKPKNGKGAKPASCDSLTL